MAVPIVKRGRVLGGMQFVSSSASRRYTPDDLALARAVAGRIASSLENRRLAERAARASPPRCRAACCRSMLPEVPGVDIAVRYWAAGEGIDVGGDFYDVFALDDGRWGVVIGDVCGTGPAAAALTGMVRHTIASAAWHGDDPVAVLEHVNRAMIDRGTNSFCTLAYGVIRPVADGVELLARGRRPPAPGHRRRPTGRPRPVGGRARWSVCSTTSARRCTGARLVRVETVVFYTDGATDVPPPHHLESEEFAQLASDAVRDAPGCRDGRGPHRGRRWERCSTSTDAPTTSPSSCCGFARPERMSGDRSGRGSGVRRTAESGCEMTTITDSSCTWTAPAEGPQRQRPAARRRSLARGRGVRGSALAEWRLIVSELAANACEHAPRGAEVEVTASCEAGQIELRVRNPAARPVATLDAARPGPARHPGTGPVHRRSARRGSGHRPAGERGRDHLPAARRLNAAPTPLELRSAPTNSSDVWYQGWWQGGLVTAGSATHAHPRSPARRRSASRPAATRGLASSSRPSGLVAGSAFSGGPVLVLVRVVVALVDDTDLDRRCGRCRRNSGAGRRSRRPAGGGPGSRTRRGRRAGQTPPPTSPGRCRPGCRESTWPTSSTPPTQPSTGAPWRRPGVATSS